MRFRAALAFSALTAVGLLSTACDSFFNYTIVNKTDQELLVWAMTDSCDKVVGNKGDYYHTERVPPGASVGYHETYGGFGSEDPRCVQAATLDRHLVASSKVNDPYSGGTLIVEQPLEPGQFIPEEDDLPLDPFSERVGYAAKLVLSGALVLVVGAVLIVAMFLVPLFVIFGIPTGLVILASRLRKRLRDRKSRA